MPCVRILQSVRECGALFLHFLLARCFPPLFLCIFLNFWRINSCFSPPKTRGGKKKKKKNENKNMENKKAAHWKVQWQPGSGGRATVICMNAAIKLTRLEYAPLRVFFVGQRGECVTWNEIPAQAAYSLYVPGIKKKTFNLYAYYTKVCRPPPSWIQLPWVLFRNKWWQTFLRFFRCFKWHELR